MLLTNILGPTKMGLLIAEVWNWGEPG